MKGLLIEADLEKHGISDPKLTMMLKEVPNLTPKEKQSIIKAFEEALKGATDSYHLLVF